MIYETGDRVKAQTGTRPEPLGTVLGPMPLANHYYVEWDSGDVFEEYANDLTFADTSEPTGEVIS